MAGNGALIDFRTNIKDVIAEIRAAVAQIDGLTNSAGKLNPVGTLISDIQIKRIQEAQRELAKLDKSLASSQKSGKAPNETLTQGQQRIASDTRRKIAEDFARNKIPIEFVAHIDSSLGPLTRSLHDAVKNAVSSGLDAGLVGSTRLRTRQNLQTIYNQTTPAPTTPKNPTPAGGGKGGGSGSTGPTGPTGSKGPSGPSGPTGASGPSGPRPSGPTGGGKGGGSGPSGPSGPTGTKGPSGPSGASGASGHSGPSGASGSGGGNGPGSGGRGGFGVGGSITGPVGSGPKATQILDKNTARPIAGFDDIGGGKFSRTVKGVLEFYQISADAAEKAAGLGHQIERLGDGADLFNYYDALGKQARFDTRNQGSGDATKAADLGKSLFSPTSANGLADDVRHLTGNIYEVQRQGVARFVEVTAQGAKEILEGGHNYRRALDASAAQLKTERDQAHAEAIPINRQKNFDRIFPSGPTGSPIASVKEIAPGLYREELQNGLKEYYRLVNGGLESVGKDAPGFARAARQDYKRRDKGFVGGLAEGVFGDRDYEDRTLESLGKSAGITAKYATLATVFYGVQGAIAQAGVELLDFQDSLTDLNTALSDVTPEGGFFSNLFGDPGPDQAFLNDLSDSASLAGANIGQAMDLASSAIRAFGEDTDQTKEAMEQMGARFAAEASKIATLTKTDIADAGGNLKAITLGFDIPTANFSRVTDVLAGARSVGGGDEKQVGQFLANIAVSAKEAGFAIEEVGALGSKVIAETDQGGQLVANRFSRLFSIIGGSAGKTAIANLNKSLSPDQQIDTGGDVRDQIVQLSRVYDQLGKSQQQQLINSLGGTANARELLILLENADTLVKKVGDEDWAGKGAEQYRKTLLDVRGVLTRITGDLRGIVTALSQSGVIDPFIALIKLGLLPALDATKDLLNTFNLIPRPIRSIALGLLGVYAAMKLIGKLGRTEAVGNILGQARATLTGNPIVGPPRPVPVTGRTGRQLLRGDTGFRDLASATGRGKDSVVDAIKTGFRERGQIAGRAGRGFLSGVGTARANVTGRAGLLATEVGPLALAVGGALAVNETFKAGFKLNNALDQAQTVQNTKIDNIGVDDFNEAAKNLRSSAAALKESSSGFFGSIVNFGQGLLTGGGLQTFFTGGAAGAAQKPLTQEAQYDERQARRLKAFQDNQAKTGQSLNITGTADEFQDSLDIMAASGASATRQFKALINAFDDFNKVGADGNKILSEGTKFNLQLASGKAGRDFVTNLRDSAEARQTNAQNRIALSDSGDFANDPALKAANADVARYNKLDPDIFSNTVETATKGFFAANPTTDITSEAGTKALTDSLYASLAASIPNAEDRQHAANTVVGELLKQVPKESVISPETLAKIVENAVPIAEASGQEAARKYQAAGVGAPNGGTTLTSKVAADAKLARLKKIRDEAFEHQKNINTNTQAGRDEAFRFNREGTGDKLDADVEQAQNEAADANVDNLRASFNQLQASKPKEDAKARIKEHIAEIDKELAEPFISPDKRIALQTERAETVVAQNQQAQLDAMAASRAKFSVFDEVGQATADNDDANRILKENFTDKGITSGADYEQAKANAERTALAKQQAIDTRDAAKRNRNAFNDDEVASSDAALADGEQELATLKKYAKDSTAYYDKQREVVNLRRDNAEKHAKLSTLQAQLGSDLTDPVQQDAINLKAAQDKLTRDRKNKAPASTIAQDQKDVYDQTAKLDADAFSQRLGDIQHAHDQGRISNQAFLEYMTSERTRLKLRLAGMKKTDQGYRQTVEQIQSLDDGIKSAADTMSGMFNIGNIDIPTPYQVRRALETKGPGNILGDNPAISSGGNVTNDSSNNQVILNGVPIQQVLAIIEDLFGKKARSRAKQRVA